MLWRWQSQEMTSTLKNICMLGFWHEQNSILRTIMSNDNISKSCLFFKSAYKAFDAVHFHQLLFYDLVQMLWLCPLPLFSPEMFYSLDLFDLLMKHSSIWLINATDQLLTLSEFCVTLTFSILINSSSLDNWFWYTVIIRSWLTLPKCVLGAVSIRKTVLPGMAIPMLKIRRPNGRLIFNMEIAIRR